MNTQDILREQEFTSKDIKVILRPDQKTITFMQLCELCNHKPGTVRNLIEMQFDKGFNYCKIGGVAFTFELLNKPWSEKIHNK